MMEEKMRDAREPARDIIPVAIWKGMFAVNSAGIYHIWIVSSQQSNLGAIHLQQSW